MELSSFCLNTVSLTHSPNRIMKKPSFLVQLDLDSELIMINLKMIMTVYLVLFVGEWWKSDVDDVMNQWTQTGLPPNVSDAHTINGFPGLVPNCSTSKGTKLPIYIHIKQILIRKCSDYIEHSTGYTLHVEAGKTYLLRIINAALNEDLFFKIARHIFTVVEVDACYVKPFKTDTIYIAPGQTTNVLLTADQNTGKYLMAISPFMDTIVAVDNQTATSTVQYKSTEAYTTTTLTTLPAVNATPATNSFIESLRSLNSAKYPALVPLEIDHSLVFVVGVGVNNCSTCVNGSRVLAGINNVTFVMPTIALLQAHYYNINGVFTADFPGKPVTPYNYTGNNSLTNIQITNGTKVYPLEYNSTVQVVIQGNSVIAPESHPIHLHGFNFFVVGKGLGNFDPVNDPKKFNLVDPVERNTLNVPTAGWTAIRFRADNPGIYYQFNHNSHKKIYTKSKRFLSRFKADNISIYYQFNHFIMHQNFR